MSLRLGLLVRGCRDVQLLVGLFLVFCGTALGLSAADIALDYRRALELRGMVTAKELVRADAENPATRFVARYRLVLPEGETVETEEDLPREVWEARAIGSEHALLYLPAQRRTLRSGELESALIMAVISLGLLIGGALAARAPARRLVARLHALQRGVPASASVVDVFQTSTAVNRVILWQLRYKYRDASGAEREGESELLWPAEAALWQPGALGAIVYDKARPESSVWLGHAPGEAPAPGPAARAWLGARLRAAARWGLNLALFFGALIVAAALAELVPELKALEIWMEARRGELLIATVGASVAGIFTLVGAVIAMLMERGAPMDHTAVENHQRTMREAQASPLVWRASTYRLFGRGAGFSAHDEFSLAELKRAIASGALLRETAWRRRACAALGALLIFLGLFGTLIVVTPLALKLVLTAVALYVVLMLAWGFVRA